MYRERNIEFTTLCADYYKKNTIVDAYSIPIIPIGNPEQWVVPDFVRGTICLPPFVRTQTGRPRQSRIRSVAETTRTQKCKSCGTVGHNSRSCPNPIVQSESSGRRPIPDEMRRKCGICKERGHNRLTCPQNITNAHHGNHHPPNVSD